MQRRAAAASTPLRGAAGAHIDVDAGSLGARGVEDAGNVAVADEADGGAGFAHFLDQAGMARPVENADRKILDRNALGLGECGKVLGRGRVEIDEAVRVAAPDSDLFHVDVGHLEEAAAGRHGNDRQRVRQVLGAQGRAFQRHGGDVDLRAVESTDLLADIEMVDGILSALADDDGTVDRQVIELALHGVDGGKIGGALIAAAPHTGGGHRGALGDPDQLDGQDTVDRGADLLLRHSLTKRVRMEINQLFIRAN